MTRADLVQVGDLIVTEDGRTVRVTDIREVDGQRVLYTEPIAPPCECPWCVRVRSTPSDGRFASDAEFKASAERMATKHRQSLEKLGGA